MVIVTEAIFDGKALQLQEPLAIPANSRVRVTIESEETPRAAPTSFLDTARNLNLEGPPDWSENLDAYLYGDKDIDGT